MGGRAGIVGNPRYLPDVRVFYSLLKFSFCSSFQERLENSRSGSSSRNRDILVRLVMLMRVLFLLIPVYAVDCGKVFSALTDGIVFADIHDGDMKKVEIDGEKPAIKITPHGNDQTWVVQTRLDEGDDCRGEVDFRVPNKPKPPPVQLKVQFGFFTGGDDARAV